MRMLPSSPRARRRFIRIGIAVGIVAVLVGFAVFARGGKQPSASPPKNAPRAQLIKQSKYVSPAERRAIDRTLDQFIPAALNRRSEATAWRLAGPQLKGGTTLREWRHGTSPIPYYPARGKSFHSWKVIDSGPGYVDFNILVHPKRGDKTSSWVFSGSVVKEHGRWLVNGMYTIAIMARPDKHGRHEVGPDDFAAGGASQSGQGGAPPRTGGAALGTSWLFVAGGVFLLAILFPIGFGIVSVVKSRRRRAEYARPRAQALPPLPRSTPSEPAGGGGIGAQRH